MTIAAQTTPHATTAGLDLDTLKLMLEALGDFVAAELPESRILELDHEDRCPEETVRAMSGDALGWTDRVVERFAGNLESYAAGRPLGQDGHRHSFHA